MPRSAAVCFYAPQNKQKGGVSQRGQSVAVCILVSAICGIKAVFKNNCLPGCDFECVRFSREIQKLPGLKPRLLGGSKTIKWQTNCGSLETDVSQ